MPLFTQKPIIVPWDYSDMSKNALAKAFELAESGEQIEVIHVTPYPSAVDVEPTVIWGSYSEEVIRENLTNSFRDDIPEDKYPGIVFSALFGDPGTKISDRAKAVDAGLIVISSHGRKGLKRLLLGSVAERVIRLAPCPVLVLRDDED